MPTKKQKGGFTQTANERRLWLSTTPEMKAYWREEVRKEKERKLIQNGQGIHFFENHPVGKLFGPLLQSIVTNSQYIPGALINPALKGLNITGKVLKKAVLGRGKKPRATKK